MKCTKGIRHKWKHVRNKEYVSQGFNSMSMTVRGIYQCECGAKKVGEYQHVRATPSGEGRE